MGRKQKIRAISAGLVSLVLIFLAPGCTLFGTNQSQNGEPSPPADAPKYLDFGDILIPSEMDCQQSKSFVFKTTGQSAGVISLKGRVEMDSLIAFFENNMVKDNWRMVSYFKSRRTLMLFQKDTRWCVVNISDGDFYTSAEIWVSPTVGGLPAETLMR